MVNRYRLLWAIVLFWTFALSVKAQLFFNLTADEVKIDSVLPQFTYSFDLDEHYADSTYHVSLAYPEFLPLSSNDLAQYHKVAATPLSTLPAITQRVVVSRKKGKLEVSFVPLVQREGKIQYIVSFMLKVSATAKSSRDKVHTRAQASGDATQASRYASHSVLASGKWAKIRVPSSGIFQLTSELVRKAGFSDLSKVKIYGYGGALQPEALDGDYLKQTDDLHEVAQCVVGDKRLFWANGPVSWNVSGKYYTRVRNYCSDYGYYFLTESNGSPLTVDSVAFVSPHYPSADYLCSLYEKENYSWFEGGRNLYDSHAINNQSPYTFSLTSHAKPHDTGGSKGAVTVVVTANAAGVVSVSMNGQELGKLTFGNLSTYERGRAVTQTYYVDNILPNNEFTITNNTVASEVRLDYVSVMLDDDELASGPQLLKDNFPVPEYVYNITNQDHHADTFADMVIVIPTTQTLLAQAQRLAAKHESQDGLRVRIVPADELFNEFSSGTPDVNAYRRYLKMLYDRAETEADMPKYLLLFGDALWDNRMNTSSLKSYSPDNFLLAYESENSFSKTDSYADDGFFALLDDGEGVHSGSGMSDKYDIGVGRFPVRNVVEAKAMVDKTIAYMENKNMGAWQNILMFMGDDGHNTASSRENSIHMQDADNAAKVAEAASSAFDVKRVMWDAYTRESSSTGDSYPEVEQIIKNQQAAGALVMDYSGHAAEQSLSHEMVLKLSDFNGFANKNYPLWITAACDVAPFDGTVQNIGENAVLNANGGAVAFFAAGKTVYQPFNAQINQAFLRYALNLIDGKRPTLGYALMKGKNSLSTTGSQAYINKVQYILLGDPALALNIPTMSVVVDSINGQVPTSEHKVSMKTGMVVSVDGHVEQAGVAVDGFTGLVNLKVFDSKELVVCKGNDPLTTEIFQFYDRQKVLYNGTDSVKAGRFHVTFAVPQDINYSGETGKMTLYAYNADGGKQAHGSEERFVVAGGEALDNDSIGPSIYCYLNSPSFVDGGSVNPAPYFVANISDKDGINASGNGIGHDLELVIDGELQKTYNLNERFQYDCGSYTKGTTSCFIPELSEGMHKLKFRAWDILNNSSTVELTFKVVKGLQPNLLNLSCTSNPARTSTTFILSHDRAGSNIDVEIEVFDMTGRILWSHQESGVAEQSTYTVDWDLTTNAGSKLSTGVYLYRARLSSNGSSKASKAKKLIVIGNN